MLFFQKLLWNIYYFKVLFIYCL